MTIYRLDNQSFWMAPLTPTTPLVVRSEAAYRELFETARGGTITPPEVDFDRNAVVVVAPSAGEVHFAGALEVEGVVHLRFFNHLPSESFGVERPRSHLMAVFPRTKSEISVHYEELVAQGRDSIPFICRELCSEGRPKADTTR